MPLFNLANTEGSDIERWAKFTTDPQSKSIRALLAHLPTFHFHTLGSEPNSCLRKALSKVESRIELENTSLDNEVQLGHRRRASEASRYTLPLNWMMFSKISLLKQCPPVVAHEKQGPSWHCCSHLSLGVGKREQLQSDTGMSLGFSIHWLWDHKQVTQFIWPSVKWDKSTFQICCEDLRKYVLGTK